MDKFVRWYPVLFMLALAGLTLWIDEKVQPPPPVRDGSARHDPDFIVDNFAAQRMNVDGSRRYAVEGKRMVHYPDDNSTQIETPHFTHFDAEEKHASPVFVTAKRGLVSRNGENVYFIGDVRIDRAAYADQPPLALRTEFLHIIPDQDLAKTDKPLTMTHGTSRVDAVGMVFDNRARTLNLLSNVKVHYDSPVRLPDIGRR